MTKTELAQSIKDWLEGDERAFTPVFYYYYSKLLQFSEQFMADEPLREELVMNVLLKIWKAKDAITSLSTFNAYVYKAMRNEIISSLRAKKKSFAPLESVKEDPHTESDYEYNAVARQYRACVDKLPRKRKEIFLMSLERGLTYPQIARELNISVNTVQKQVTAAVQAIRKELNPDDTDNAAMVAQLGCFAFVLLESMLS